MQLGDVLRVLKSDTRADLRTLLAEFSLKGLGGGGAEAFNDTIDYMEPAYKSTAVVNDALLGENPTRTSSACSRASSGWPPRSR